MDNGFADNRIAILGGTFDPPHLGHLALATGVADALGLDRVVLMPTGNPHFKQDVKVTPAADRVAMTRLLAQCDPRLEVSTLEAEREGITYTVDTLRALQGQNPGAQLVFVVGGDCVAHIWRWYAADELARLCKVVAVERRGFDYGSAKAALEQSGVEFDIEYLAFDVPEVSSTNIRTRAAAGASLEELVPASVACYIQQHTLYS